MAISLKHDFQSLKGDGTDPTQVQPSNWNDEHKLTLASNNLIGRLTDGNGAAEEIPISDFMASVLNSADANSFLAALGIGGFTVGDVKWSFRTSNIAGWLRISGVTTIGNAASGATFADAAAKPLFDFIWANVGDTWAPVSGGRGGNSTLDFNNNKKLTIPALTGRSPIGTNSASGNVGGAINWVAGQTAGENNHVITVAELAQHAHANTLNDPTHNHLYSRFNFNPSTPSSGFGSSNPGYGNQAAATSDNAATGMTITNANAGSNTAHNTLHPVVAMVPFVKL